MYQFFFKTNPLASSAMIIFRWSGSLQIYDEMYMRVIGTERI